MNKINKINLLIEQFINMSEDDLYKSLKGLSRKELNNILVLLAKKYL